MGCRRIQRMLSSYLDGELSSVQTRAVEEHLRGCARCQKALADLRLLVSQAKNLASATLISDLWPAIERRALSPPVVSPAKHPRRASLSGWRPRIAWAFALAAIFLIIFFHRDHIYTPKPNPPTPQDRTQLMAQAKADLNDVQTLYQSTISALEQIVAHRAHEMDPERARLYRDKLVCLEEAIGECSIALDKNSYNMRAQRALFDAYDRKISTLREMAVSAAY